MNQSENIQELVKALSTAQAVMGPAKFNKTNPHFKSRYADFTSVMEACRVPLTNNGLAIMQYCETVNDKLTLVTMLAHVSGQWIKSYYPLLPAQMTSQAIGSCMTYAKRYSLSAMMGIVADDDDDDGEKADVQPKQPVKLINAADLHVLEQLDKQLNEECRDKIHQWLMKDQRVNGLKEILEVNFLTVKNKYLNAIKYMEQQSKESTNA